MRWILLASICIKKVGITFILHLLAEKEPHPEFPRIGLNRAISRNFPNDDFPMIPEAEKNKSEFKTVKIFTWINSYKQLLPDGRIRRDKQEEMMT